MKLFAKDLLRYLPGEAGLIVLALVSVPILTRVLSPDQFGSYALVLSSVMVAVFLFGSYPMGIIRFYPAVADEDRELLVRTSVWTQMITVVGAALLCLIPTWLLWTKGAFLLSLVIAGTAIAVAQSLFQLLVEVLRAGLQVEAYNLYRVFNKIAGLSIGLALAIIFDLGVLGILWGIALGLLTTLPFVWRRVFASFRAIGPLSNAMAREVGGFGLPLVIGNLGGWVLSQFDRYFIQLYFGAHEVGLYAAAYTISQHSITMLASFFMLSSTPLLTNTWENEGQQASQRLIVSITRTYLLVGVPAVFGLSALAEPIMTVLTGAQFSGGYVIVPWVAAGAFFLGLQHRYNQVLRLVRRTRDIMLWILLAGGLNILLNWWLLPIFGYQMAAVTTFASYVALCAGQAWSSSRQFYWPFPWGTTLRSCVAAGIMFAGVWLLKNTLDVAPIVLLFVAMPAGMAIYGISLWALGEVSLTEAKALQIAGKQWINGFGLVQRSKVD